MSITRLIQFAIGRAVRVAGFCLIMLAGTVLPGFAQDASKKLLVAYSGLITMNASLWVAEDLDYLRSMA